MANADDLRRRVRRAAVVGGRRAAERTARAAKKAAPVKTGETRDKTGLTGERITLTSATWTVEAKTPQARYVEFGTRPHVIRPRRARALRFFWPRVGRVVFFAKVNHPGNRPKPWFYPTIREEWPRAVNAEVGRLLR